MDTPVPAEPPTGTSPSLAARRFTPGLIAIALAGMVGRIAYLVLSRVDDTTVFRQGDAVWYSLVANAFARGDGFTNPITQITTADHPPVTVLVLAPSTLIAPDSTLAHRLTMVLLGTATIVVIGLAGRRLAGPVAGLVAATVAAALPSLWVSDVLIMSETPTALVVALLLWIGVALAARPSTRLVVAAGALCGLAALTRGETGLFLPLMVWPLIIRSGGDGRRRLGWIGAATAAAALVLAPWTAYNLTRFEEPVPISTNDGPALVGANCAEAYRGSIIGSWTIDPCLLDAYAAIDRDKPGAGGAGRQQPCPDLLQERPPCYDASEISRLTRDEAVTYAQGHASDLPRVVHARHGRVWGWYEFEQSVRSPALEGRPSWVSRIGYYTLWATLPLVGVGAWALRRRGTSLVPFAASLLTVLLVTTAVYGLVRFRLPFDVASCLLVGVAVPWLVQRARGVTVAAEPAPDPPAGSVPTTSPAPSTRR